MAGQNRWSGHDPMAGGGVTPDTCLALGRRCWAFDMEERAETRPEIESHTWIYSPDQELSWPVSSKGKADLVIFDLPTARLIAFWTWVSCK